MPLKTLTDFPLSSHTKEPAWIDKDIQAVREKVISDKRLKSRTDDEFLLRFLRARKYDRERAFKMLKNYCAMKKRYPEIFTDLTPSAMMDLLNDDILMYMPKPDLNGRYIAIGRARLWDISKVSLIDVIRLSHLFLESLILEDTMQINGFVLILDAKGITLRHLMQVTPSMVLLVLHVFLDSFPVRYKAIHIINSTKLTDLIIAAFWPFLPSKFKQRIFVHSTLESLHQHVDAKFLSEELGGEMGPYDSSHCIEKLLKQEAYFQEHQEQFLS